MVTFQTSVLVTTEQDAERKQRGVGWRYVIGKGLEYLREIEPKLNEIALSHERTRRANSAVALLAWLRSRHPEVWDEYLAEGANGVVPER